MKKLNLNDLKPVKVLSKDEQKTIKGGAVIKCICQNDSGEGSSEHLLQCETTSECVAGCQAICG